MRNAKTRPALSELEHLLMDYVWRHGPASADDYREALRPRRDLKDSTIRTVLRRLEEKGYVKHEVDGRTYLYRAAVASRSAAAQAVQRIVERFCGGSVEELLVGLVDQRVVDGEELREIAARIARAKGERS